MIQSRRSQSVAHTHTSRMMVLVLLLWIGASSSSSVFAVLSATADSTLSPPELPRHHLLNPNNAQQQQPASTLHFVSSPPASQSSQSIPSTTHSRRSRFPRAETITGAAQSTNSSSSVIITNALRMAFFYSTDITDLGYSYQINTARRAALRTMRLQYPNISIQHFVYPGMVPKGKAATRAAVYEALDVHQVHVVVACSVDIYLAWPDTTSLFAMVQSYPHVRFLDLNLNRLLTQGWPANFAAQGFAIQGALFLAGAVAGSSCVDAVGLLMPAASTKSSASAFYKGMLFGQRYNSRYATMNINHTYDNHTICRLYAINQNTFSAPSSEIQLSKLFIGLKCSVIFFWCDTRTAPLWIKEANVSVQSITWAADGTLVVGDSVLSGIVLYPYNAFQNVTRDVITGKPLNQSYYLWRIGVDTFLGRVSALAPRNATLAKEAALRLIYERQGGVFCEDFYNSSGHLVWSPAQAGVPCMSQADMSLRYNVFSPGITVLPDYIHSKGLCAPGYFVARDPNTFLPHCELCPEGSISTSTGTDVCTPCRSPMVSDSNHTLCIHVVVVPTDHSVLIVLIVSSLIAFALVVALIAYLRGVWVHDGDWAWPFRVHHDEAAVTGELLHRVVEAPEGPMIALALLAIDPGLGDRSWRQQLSVMSDIYQMLFDAVKTVSVELHVYVALNVGDVFLLAHQSAETLAIAVRRIDALFMEYSQNNSHHAAMVSSYGLALRCVVHYCEPTVVSNQRTTTGNNNNKAKKKPQLSQNNISSSLSPAASSSSPSPPKWGPNAVVPPPPASSNDEASGADDTASIAESRASSTRRRKRSSRVEYSGPCLQFVKKLWGSEQIFPQVAWKGWGGSGGGGERDLDVVSNESSPTPSLTRAALRHQRLASKPAVVIGVPSALAEQAAINVPSQQQRPASRFVITHAALNEVTHSLKCEPHGLVPEFDSEILAEQQQQQQQQPSLSQENVKDSLQARNQEASAGIAAGPPQEGVVATTTLSSCIPRSFAVAVVNHDNRQLTVALPPHLMMPPPHISTTMLPLSLPTTITSNPLPLPQTQKKDETRAVKVGHQPAASSPKNGSNSKEKGAALVVEDQQHSSKVEKGDDDDESDARAPLPLPTSDEEEAVMEQHAAEAMVMHSNNTNNNDTEVLTPVAPSIPPNNNSNNNNNNHENHTTVMELFDLLVVLDALSGTKDAPLGAGIGGGGGGDHHGRGGSSVGGDHAAGLSSWSEGFGITSSDAAPRIPLALCPMPSLPYGEGKFAGGELPSFRNDDVSPKSGLVDAQGASNGPSQSHRGGAVHLPSSSSSLTTGGGRGAGGGGVGSPPTVLDATEHRGLRLAPASAPPPQRVVQQQQQQFHPITGVSGDPQHVTSSSDPASHHNQSSLFPSNSSFSSLLASDQGTVVNATGGNVVSPGGEQQQGTRRRTTVPVGTKEEDSFMDWSDTDRSDHPIGLMPSNYTTTTATTTMNKHHHAGVSSPGRQAERGGGARGERRQREIMSLFGNARATMLTESQLLTVTRITYGILNRFLLLACQLQSSEIDFNDEKGNKQQQVDNEENDDGDSDLDDTRRPRSSIRTRSNSSGGSSAASARHQKRKDATKKENVHLISRVDLIMMAAARLRIELPVSVVMPMLYGGSDSLWGDGEHGAAQFQRRQQQKALRRSLSNSGSSFSGGGSSGGDDEETSVPSASGFSRRVTMILENDRRRTAVPMQMQGVSERKRWQEKLTSLHLVKQYRAEVQHVTKGTLKRVAAQVVLTMDELLLVEWLRTAGLAYEQQTVS